MKSLHTQAKRRLVYTTIDRGVSSNEARGALIEEENPAHRLCRGVCVRVLYKSADSYRVEYAIMVMIVYKCEHYLLVGEIIL